MATDVILVFDVGKTNKKALLFDQNLDIVSEDEIVFPEIPDDDGFKGDDIERIEEWISRETEKFLNDPSYQVKAINFTTYGATLMYLDRQGNRLTPVYNYLKPMPEGIVEDLYESHGGIDEFCRKTASPALGMLNSGLQALWLKKSKPEIYARVQDIVHFPQYLSSRLTGVVSSEHTSIGCHTGLWDFDTMKYHDWVGEEGLSLPEPVPVDRTHPAKKLQSDIPVGIGIHDSSASLVPYFQRSDSDFILISTGTWCISMNPFNHSPLTADQLKQDCLAYMSVQQKPVKSSRFFLGHIHDVNVERLNDFFKQDKDAYKRVIPDPIMINRLNQESYGKRVFFASEMPDDFLDWEADLDRFLYFEEAYHQLMKDLTELTVNSIRLVTSPGDKTENIYITGGFSRNPLFTNLIAASFPMKKVYTSEIANATSLGAALLLRKCFGMDEEPGVDLGLHRI